ncbi:hypothetical protein G3480_14060 [Thiorhodococcus mannitoliphagus]|uniref:DUF5666 domain-containing protein n=1 Tax=Thiorhodococcus mannitoliphagus TaxID=329406 RepID=A0A6P1E113_9GAMM|nr:hypothetical protein [Thiorhodococcus mannitoliphagus]NEX21425.1 hypothetical protein [Thiorhodococcus mannitoliphagus]
MSSQTGPAMAYDVAGSVTAIDPSGRSIEVNERQYRLSSQARVEYDSAAGQSALSVTSLRLGEYVQLETQGDTILKIRRYRKGPPH